MSDPIDGDELYERVWQLRREDKLPEAEAAVRTALPLARTAGERSNLARVLCVAGQIERDLERESAAAACYGEAVELYREVGDQTGLAYALRHECDLLRELGRLEEADLRGTEGLAAHRALKAPPLDLANMLRVYALLKQDRGELASAKPLWIEAADLYEAAQVDAGVENRGDWLTRSPELPATRGASRRRG